MRTGGGFGGDGLIGLAGQWPAAALAAEAAFALPGAAPVLPGWFGLCPLDGGRLELSGVFGGWPSRASRSATRAVSACTCAQSAWIRASFSAWLSWSSGGSWVTESLNRIARDRVNRDFADACVFGWVIWMHWRQTGVEQLPASSNMLSASHYTPYAPGSNTASGI
jgi:hypothetical protein